MALASNADDIPPDSSAVAIRGGAIRVLGYASGLLLSLGSATILVRYLGVESFGRYVTVTSLIALVGGVTEAGIVVYGIREWGRRSQTDRRELMANLLTLRLMLGAVGVTLAVAFAFVAGYHPVLIIGTAVAGIGLLVQIPADVLSISLQAQLQLGRLSAVELGRRLLSLTVIAALALADTSMLPFFATTTIAGVAILAVIARMVRASIVIRLGFDRQMWKELFVETLPYAIALAIASVYLYVTVIVMSLIASPTQTGLFATSFRIIQVGLTVPGLLLTAVFPLMVRGNLDSDALGVVVAKVVSVALICGVWMSLAIVLCAPFIVAVVGGHQARGAVSVLRIQGGLLTVGFIATSCALTLTALRRYRPLLIGSTCALAMNIALALALVPALGARGGAIADVATEGIMALALTTIVAKVVPRHELKASLALPVLPAVGLALAAFLLPIGALGRTVFASVIYFAILLAAGVIPAEVTHAAQRLKATRIVQ